MSVEEKIGLLKVNIQEFKAYKNELVDQILIKLLECMEKEKKWKYWKCCLCKERFTNRELLMQHACSEKLMLNL